MKPLLTILLPIHNDEKWLGYCLDSIRDQTFKNFICLVGFNGTVDSSKEIFNTLCKQDKRFHMIDYGQTSGKSRTLNLMLENVETEYTCLMDGDDIWNLQKLEKQVNSREDFDVIGTMAHYINEKNEIIHTLNLDLESGLIKSGLEKGHNQIINSSSMISTSCLRQAGGWDHEVEGMEDFDLWIKIHLLGKRFKNLHEPLVYHRIHQGSNFNAKKLPITIEDILKRNNLC
jgi:glycosyltransferase involved in cell wall biosynthesis